MSFEAHKDDEICINTLRTLAVDIVNKANSGHPGAPMGMSPITHVLLSRFFRCSPKNPKWPNRDRFVLSNGHACALQYSFLHLLGYDVTLEDLKSFRQVDSRTPGHPEVGVLSGVEVTTGPLGQGISNAVGLAIAQMQIGATFNRPGFDLFTNYTYAFAGDGCMQEGVASEACSLAGHLQLGNLIVVYDDNGITIDGHTEVSFTEDVAKRYEAYGWHVQHVKKGDDDLSGMYNAIQEAQNVKDKPSFIVLTTVIGFGSKLQGTHDIHGSVLKPDDAEAVKTKFGFDPKATFVVPEATRKAYSAIAEKGAKLEADWNDLLKRYCEKYDAEGKDLKRRLAGHLPGGWEKALPTYSPSDSAIASRKLSETVIGKLVDVIPELVSGSADLTGSNLTRWKSAVDFQPAGLPKLGRPDGRYFRFGVREHGMSAIMNGLAAYGDNLLIPCGGTFLNFVSYGAGSVRLAALSHFRVIWVATHDSIGLGEDGPTHQPIETVAHFRALPNCMVWRPADGNETSAAYMVAINAKHTPSIICLSRQNLPQLENSTVEHACKGGYIVHDPSSSKADLVLVSTGSEVSICVAAVAELEKKGLKARVVSLPCWEVFDQQSAEYRLGVLPDGVPIISVEALSTLGWAKYSHAQHGIDTFGASGPYKKVYEKYHMTGPAIAAAGEKVVQWYKSKGVTIVSPLNRPLSV